MSDVWSGMLNLHRVWGACWELLIGHLGDGVLNLEIECGSHHATDNFKSTPGLVGTRCTEKEGTVTRGHPGGCGLWKLKHNRFQSEGGAAGSSFSSKLSWLEDEFQGPGIPVRWKPQEAWGSPSKDFPKAWNRKNCSLQGQLPAAEFYLGYPPAQ